MFPRENGGDVNQRSLAEGKSKIGRLLFIGQMNNSSMAGIFSIDRQFNYIYCKDVFSWTIELSYKKVDRGLSCTD